MFSICRPVMVYLQDVIRPEGAKAGLVITKGSGQSRLNQYFGNNPSPQPEL